MIGKGRMRSLGWYRGLRARFHSRRLLPGGLRAEYLLPANGGDGSEGFVIPRIVPTWIALPTQ